jgi:eukaryotic-like serine/threonine-protein kinase
MAPPPSVSRRAFLANLRRSGLLTADQLAAVEDRLPMTERGRVLARALVEMGVLTRFQAERLLAGRTGGFLLDQYVILEQIGEGGMGRVYKARHRTMNRVVALKILAPSLMRAGRAQDLFLREVRAAAQLVHPNIVTAFDANQSEGRFYLVMEYVDGPNLDDLVKKQGPLPVGVACELVRQAARALQYAHEQEMVHRDIKPANLLVTEVDESQLQDDTVIRGRGRSADPAPIPVVKVLDFSLARLPRPGRWARSRPRRGRSSARPTTSPPSRPATSTTPISARTSTAWAARSTSP